jgi:hypothetical protein
MLTAGLKTLLALATGIEKNKTTEDPDADM